MEKYSCGNTPMAGDLVERVRDHFATKAKNQGHVKGAIAHVESLLGDSYVAYALDNGSRRTTGPGALKLLRRAWDLPGTPPGALQVTGFSLQGSTWKLETAAGVLHGVTTLGNLPKCPKLAAVEVLESALREADAAAAKYQEAQAALDRANTASLEASRAVGKAQTALVKLLSA